jgi:hypothetical protein
MPRQQIKPFKGFGLGLRTVHYQDFLTQDIKVDFLEIISENFMVDGGRPLHVLDQLKEKYPFCMHGVSLSLGTPEGPSDDYLQRLKGLSQRLYPLWVSDHLCWTGHHGFNSHDLLPLPLTDETLAVVCRNIDHVQDVLGRPLLVENPSTYLTFDDDAYSEWAFLSALCKRTGCYLLLDINNVFVSAHNHGFSAYDYLNGIPLERVRQIHLAGHTTNDVKLIDTHDQPVPGGVWSLYAHAMRLLGDVAVMIERDANIPPLLEVLAELDIAKDLAKPTALAKQSHADMVS